MSLTSRKKRPLKRLHSAFRDSRLFIIATEGKITEKQYFKLFEESTKRCQVIVIPNKDNKSSPDHIFSNLSSFQEEYDLDGTDELWLMLDVDRWPQRKLAGIARQAKAKKYHLAISNPCFECWLYLHYAFLAKKRFSCRELTLMLTEKLGSYDKTKLDLNKFKKRIHQAIERAKKMDTSPDSRWPTICGSHVYKIVEKILNLS